MSDPQRPRTTTDSGIPATSDEFSITVGPGGPIPLHDHYVVQKMQHFNRERVPERVVHAKGGGAHGFFEVTEDVSQYTKANFLQPGKRSPLFVRFSTVAGEQGFPDTVRDPTKFQDFIHSQKRLPNTGLRNNDMQWDFWTLSPESAHQVIILMSDRGTPRTWRHQHGFSSHTYSWINAGGERFWVKYRWKTAQEIENFTDSEAAAMTAEDPDFHRRDLWESIARGEAPEWKLMMQIMPFDEAPGYRFNPFDLTKVWPHGDYPEMEVGRMVLDRNPENFFAEVEQAGFNPSNLVPGTGLSPDKMLMGRIFSYHDTHLYRIGTNYEQLPINAPKSPVHSYNKDGAMTYRHSGNQPVYAPNSFGGPQADPEHGSDLFWHVPEGELGRYAYEKHAEDDDFGQPGTLYREVMNDTDREHLVQNIVGHASNEVTPEMQARVIAYWSNVDDDLGARVAAGLGRSDGAASNGAGAEARELLAARANRA